MRGWPLAQVLAALALCLLMLIPLVSLSGGGGGMEPGPAGESIMEAPGRLVSLQVEASAEGEVEIEAGAGPVLSIEADAECGEWRVAVPEEGGELVVRCRFSEPGQRGAVRVILREGGQRVSDSTWWGTGEVADIVVIPGRK